MADPVRIAAGILQKLGSEGVQHLKETGELPAVKLTELEMSFLRGGSSSPAKINIWKAIKEALGL